MNNRLVYLRDKTSKLTTSPGVYIMKRENGEIIYIGKAKNLRNRVKSYFCKTPNHTPKVAAMVDNVYDYEFIVTDSEYEALVLECSLIKQHMPKYNIDLKDSKGYYYIRVTSDKYPRLVVEGDKSKPGKYLGPYVSITVAKEAIIEANKVFKIPTCNKNFDEHSKCKGRACLNYNIKQCIGACVNPISANDYRRLIYNAVEYIKSGSVMSVKQLEEKMNKAAEDLDFEKATAIRNRINAIKKAADNQKIICENMEDTDFIGIEEDTSRYCISVLNYRNGRLVNKGAYFINKDNCIGELSEILYEFMNRYYLDNLDIPKRVITEKLVEDTSSLKDIFRENEVTEVKLGIAVNEEDKGLLNMSKKNSKEYLGLRK